MNPIAAVLEMIKLGDQAFFLFASLAVIGAAGAAFSRNIVYASFSLLGSLFGVAALFAWLSADYLAITQVIVYVGGILVLFLFAVMLTNRITEVKNSNPSVGLPVGFAVLSAILGLLLYVVTQTPWKVVPEPARAETTAQVGDALLSTYLLPFEFLSIVILGALVGSVLMARKEIKD